jgi:hypothetical protein
VNLQAKPVSRGLSLARNRCSRAKRPSAVVLSSPVRYSIRLPERVQVPLMNGGHRQKSLLDENKSSSRVLIKISGCTERAEKRPFAPPPSGLEVGLCRDGDT